MIPFDQVTRKHGVKSVGNKVTGIMNALTGSLEVRQTFSVLIVEVRVIQQLTAKIKVRELINI